MKLHRSIPILGFITAILLGVGLFFAHPILAAEDTGAVDLKGFEQFAQDAGFSTEASIMEIITRLIRTFLTFLGVLMVVYVLYGGFLYMTSGGETERIKKAKKILINAMIGLVIILSSYAIVQFVLNSITGATGAGSISQSDQQSGGGSYSSSKGKFYLNEPNLACADIQNVQLQFIFSKKIKIDPAGVVSGIVIKKQQDGSVVKGTFKASGSKISFVASTPCAAPNEKLFCLDANTNYSITVDPTQIKPASGDAGLVCNDTHPCSYSFKTGSGVDTKGPIVSMNSPKEGESLFVGDYSILQAKTIDDVGVSLVDFIVDGADEPVFSAGLDFSKLLKLTGANVENHFSTDPTVKSQEWNTLGYVTNKSYSISAEGSDCSGQTSKNNVSIILRAGNCNNKTLDAAAGETGLNCGGDIKSSKYCGACKNAKCDTNAECASGSCKNGVCQDVTVIKSLSPGDGAIGNLMTISGSGFGTTPGKIHFLGSKPDEIVTVDAYQCGKIVSWGANEIVVQVPVKAVDGPIKVDAPDTKLSDRTDDENGPSIANFDVNAIVRPGLCSLTPDKGNAGAVTTALGGLGFGKSQGSSTVYFSNYLASSYPNPWTDLAINAAVPNVNAGTYQTQVFTGDSYCIDSVTQNKTTNKCTTTLDCDKTKAEFCGTKWCAGDLKYCTDDTKCAVGMGKCVSVRVGSNVKTFEATSQKASEKPVISYIDSGWRACKAGLGANAGKACGKDVDCGGGVGTCEDQKTWGPSGQYITIYGSNFGTGVGTVIFKNKASKITAIGDTKFAAACGTVKYWYDDSITVKVPKNYLAGIDAPVIPGDFEVTVDKGVESAPSPFVVLNALTNTPGPSVCKIDPTAGPVGLEVKFYGENFGQKGFVTFNSKKPASVGIATWNNDLITNILVPKDSIKGPVFVENSLGFKSNSINFTVGSCTKTSCSAGEKCCSDGACRDDKDSCDVGPKVSHFAYKVSTGVIPVAPTVIESCANLVSFPGIISPSPSYKLSNEKGGEVCVNAAITASFKTTTIIDEKSLSAANIVVQKCDTVGNVANGECIKISSDPLLEGIIAPFVNGFSWTFKSVPKKNLLEKNTSYLVTLRGEYKTVSGKDGIKSAEGAFMAKDYKWIFKTAKSEDLCGLGSVNVNPFSYLATEENKGIPYHAALVSNNDKCVVIPCDGYPVAWSSSDIIKAMVTTEQPGHPNEDGSKCKNIVSPLEDTDIKSVDINAAVTDKDQSKEDGKGLLTIKFAAPSVVSFSPNCSEACVNVKPVIVFNKKVEGVSNSTILLYKCNDELCSQPPIASGITITPSSVHPETHTTVVVFNKSLDPNTWYRIVVKGEIKTSSGVLLSKSSNYLEPGNTNNKYYPGDFSWKFKTKASNVSCGVDRVSVLPKSQTLTYIGQRAVLTATAFGAPDACSVTGQALQMAEYDWSPWISKDEPNNFTGTLTDVVTMLASANKPAGAIELTTKAFPNSCSSSSCLFKGMTIKASQATCGNGGVPDKGEDCDDGNTAKDDGCSDKCLMEGSVSPVVCGNKNVEKGEQCDDGNEKNGDGCSSKCLNEGFDPDGSICGNDKKAHSTTKGGESCDDGNDKNGDGCSAACLNEGTVAKGTLPLCGDNIVTKGEQCDGGNSDSGDGCSSSCLFEGSNKIKYGSVCGDNIKGTGEQCDDNNTINGDGCSSKCLKEGSSAFYPTASYCGDGVIGHGEECDSEALASASPAPYKVGGYAVAEIGKDAAKEIKLDLTSNVAVSNITVKVANKTDVAEVKLSCSCTDDNSCGGQGISLGCGFAKCCFKRPIVGVILPMSGATNLCRNTALSVSFDQEMDPKTFGSNIQLELIETAPAVVGGPKVAVTKDGCEKINGHKFAGKSVGESSNGFAKAWQWVKEKLFGFVGLPARANAPSHCFVPVTYQQVGGGNDWKVNVLLTAVLEKNATYKLTVKDGVLSKNLVGLGVGKGKLSLFSTGEDVCKLDLVSVEDTGIFKVPPLLDHESKSKNYFSKQGEQHKFIATAQTMRKNGDIQDIGIILNVYDWTWAWDSSPKDDDLKSVVALTIASKTESAIYVAKGTEGAKKDAAKNGEELIIATAKIGADTGGLSPALTSVAGSTIVTVFLCENPWPTLVQEVPFIDTNKNTNFSFFYCRDAGTSGPEGDLPPLTLSPNKPYLPTIVKHPAGDTIIQEMVFNIANTKDSVGVRVIKNDTPIGNSSYLSPLAWFRFQDFSGSPKPTKLDGYEAIQVGTTIYASAANFAPTLDLKSSTIYPNIYVLSYNPDAAPSAKLIFDQILQNFRLNANTDVTKGGINNVRLCKEKNKAAYYSENKQFFNCSTDQECESVQKDLICDASKSKLIRDTKRLTDLTDMQAKLEDFGKNNKHCSVTKKQVCTASTPCPGTEKCIKGYPTMLSGSLLPAITNSKWGSWNAVLGNALGTALPMDPLNKFWNDCTVAGVKDADKAACWNSSLSVFTCPDRSNIYGYRTIGGESYSLHSQLEYVGAPWANDISSNGSIAVEYAKGTAALQVPLGFSLGQAFCGATPFGGGVGTCGDGLKGVNEKCELTDPPQSIACAVANTGVITIACDSPSCIWQTEVTAKAKGAVCKPPVCGNGVIDAGEKCDQGSALNGTYGHCNKTCGVGIVGAQSSKAFYCGDGMLGGPEMCDCGKDDVTRGIGDWSKDSAGNCKASNGQYVFDGSKSCSYDCKRGVGPSCGDGVKNNDAFEQCDGAPEQKSPNPLCKDLSTCTIGGVKCSDGSNCGAGGAACPTTKICISGDDIGKSCSVNKDCNKMCEVCTTNNNVTLCLAVPGVDCNFNKCSVETYSLTRTRSCIKPPNVTPANACKWGFGSTLGWSACLGGAQQCGNGIPEGSEQCDGEVGCTPTCKFNVCGDGIVSDVPGAEKCDNGNTGHNKNVGPNDLKKCSAPYGSSCSYCTTGCIFKIESGAYCGDGVKNGNEVCDKQDLPYSCFRVKGDVMEVKGTCDALDVGKTSGTSKKKDQPDWKKTLCADGFTCRKVGVCNGGELYGENGKYCQMYGVGGFSDTSQNVNHCDGYCSDPAKTTCNNDKDCATVAKTTDKLCHAAGSCIAPVCAGNCLSSCPVAFQKTWLKVKSGMQGATAQSSIDLYSKNSNKQPYYGLLQIPACSVGMGITADVSGVTQPSVDIVFLTDLSAGMAFGWDDLPAQSPFRRIDFAVAATKVAITKLIGNYKNINAQLRIGLLGYQNLETAGKLKYNETKVLALEPNQTELFSILDEYTKESLDGKLPIANTMKKAIALFDKSTADVKIIVMIGRQGPTQKENDSATSKIESCIDGTKDSKLSTMDDCTRVVKNIIDNNTDIEFYSIYLGAKPAVAESYFMHMSSTVCENKTMLVTSDCSKTGKQYAYQTKDAAQLIKMYEEIVKLIVMNSQLTLTQDGKVGTGAIPLGTNKTLPFPSAFSCKADPSVMTIENVFAGMKTIKYENFEFTYCPVN